MQLSIVVPAYNEEESIPELVEWIREVMDKNKLSFEVIIIDDGSTDNTWIQVEHLASLYAGVRGIKFRRNYGKSAALNTGFEAARGDVVITMDADLQDSPEEIPELYRMITEEGYDLVSGWKRRRHDPVSKTLPSRFFNATTRWFSGIKLHDFNCGLKAYRKNVVKSIDVYGEMHRYIPVIAKWAGFKNIGEKVVQHKARKYGTTKFGFERFINGFLDLLSISFVTRFVKRPMHFFGTIGTLFFLGGGIISLYIILDKIFMWNAHRGITEQPIFYLALMAMIIGVQLFLAGFLADMISRNAPDRDHYIIEKRTDVGDPSGNETRNP
ncbi:MAG: glycosyltransferase family 2 protein [Bacteroidales bacterium]